MQNQIAKTFYGNDQLLCNGDPTNWDLWGFYLTNEFAGGMTVIASGETLAGAQRFKAGTGRHGRF